MISDRNYVLLLAAVAAATVLTVLVFHGFNEFMSVVCGV